MTAQILHALDSVRLVIKCNFVRLHNLLNGFTNITKSHVDTSRLDSRVCSFLDGEQKRVKNRIESHREGAIDDMAIDLRTVVDLHDVVGAEHSVIAGIGSVMGSAIIDAAAGRESNTRVESILLAQSQVRLLDLLADVDELHAGTHVCLRELAHLSVAFGGSTEVVDLALVETIAITVLGVGGALRVEITWMVLPLTLREHSILKLL